MPPASLQPRIYASSKEQPLSPSSANTEPKKHCNTHAEKVPIIRAYKSHTRAGAGAGGGGTFLDSACLLVVSKLLLRAGVGKASIT